MNGFTPHETIELQEILAGEVASAKKMKLQLSQVSSEELKEQLNQTLHAKVNRIKGLEQLLNQQGITQ